MSIRVSWDAVKSGIDARQPPYGETIVKITSLDDYSMINIKSSAGIPSFEKPKKTKRHFCETVDVSKFDSKIASRVKRMLKKMKQQQRVIE